MCMKLIQEGSQEEAFNQTNDLSNYDTFSFGNESVAQASDNQEVESNAVDTFDIGEPKEERTEVKENKYQNIFVPIEEAIKYDTFDFKCESETNRTQGLDFNSSNLMMESSGTPFNKLEEVKDIPIKIEEEANSTDLFSFEMPSLKKEENHLPQEESIPKEIEEIPNSSSFAKKEEIKEIDEVTPPSLSLPLEKSQEEQELGNPLEEDFKEAILMEPNAFENDSFVPEQQEETNQVEKAPPEEQFEEIEIPFEELEKEDFKEESGNKESQIEIENFDLETEEEREDPVLETPDFILEEDLNKDQTPLVEIDFLKNQEREEVSLETTQLEEPKNEEYPVETNLEEKNELPKEEKSLETKELSLDFPRLEDLPLEEIAKEENSLSPITIESTPEIEEKKEKIEDSITSIGKVQPVANLEVEQETIVDKAQIDPAITEKIHQIENENNTFGVGKIINMKEFIIEVVGLDDVSFYEKINIANKAIGYVTKIETSSVFIAVLDKKAEIVIGDLVYQTNEEYTGYFSEDALGRVINLFGVDELADKKFTNQEKIRIEEENIPIMDRTAVNRPLLTGITGIDLIYPIGRGQRQLIIGDKKTGKTQICLDTIVNQQGKNMICIYCAIGKTKKEVKEIYQELMKRGAMAYTIIITAFNDDLVPVLVLTPFYALSVARRYMMKGYDILVVLDDLKRHGDAYREISLISGKSPGRDAYPSDIFYLHSRLLEKGCQYKNGASITILPVVETRGGDITDYISTNIISITDGQIVLSAKNFQKGEKPAINYGLSVSRLGGAVQTKEMKSLGAKVRRKLLSYLDTREVYELANIDEMSPELQARIFEGKRILEQLIQPKYSPKQEEEMKEKFAFLGETTNG